MTEDSDPPKATKTELERRQLEARPGHGKSMLSMTKLLQLLPAAALLGGIDQREVERVQALAELALVLDCSIRDLEQAAEQRGFELTTDRVKLWTESAARGEIGLTEILIAMEPPPVGLRGKGGPAVFNEPIDWDHAAEREVIDNSITPEPSPEESQAVVFHRSTEWDAAQMKRDIDRERARKSSFARRAGKWRR